MARQAGDRACMRAPPVLLCLAKYSFTVEERCADERPGTENIVFAGALVRGIRWRSRLAVSGQTGSAVVLVSDLAGTTSGAGSQVAPGGCPRRRPERGRHSPDRQVLRPG